MCLGPGPAILWGPWEEPHPTPQSGSGQRDRLLARLDIVQTDRAPCAPSNTERGSLLCVSGGERL